MRQVIVNVYQFDELSDDAKEKALRELYDINVDYEWWNMAYEDAKETANLKLTEVDLNRRYCKGNFISSAVDTAKAIIDNHGKDCETYKTASQYLIERDKLIYDTPEDEDPEFEVIDKEFLNDILEDYRIILQQEHDYLTSEESIIETIKANEYEFTVNGKMY